MLNFAENLSNMTTIELQSEINRALGIIGDDYNLLQKALRSLKRLADKKQDESLMTQEDFFARVDEAREQIRRGEGYTMLPGESFADFRKRIGR